MTHNIYLFMNMYERARRVHKKKNMKIHPYPVVVFTANPKSLVYESLEKKITRKKRFSY